ncbi:hypothetical protein BJX99DRAFT_246139 [Aspergillus californicus]
MYKIPKTIYYSGSLLGQSYPCLLPSCHRYRPYATAHGEFSAKDIPWPSSPSFTPYDVVGQSRSAPYSKHRFYELVKVYHPDRPCNGHPLCKDISPEVRLQRYRIVVTAHEILSDPIRRAAYDHTGTGWNFNSVATHPRPPAWTGGDPLYANATWEDWERWYNRGAPKQETVVDHRTFVTFVVLMFFLGAAVQASWFTRVSTGYEDRLKDLNEQSMRFLNERRKSTEDQMASSDAKVQHFLIRRDPSGQGLKDGEQPVYRDALSQQGIPSSVEVPSEEGRKAKEDDHMKGRP